MLKSCSILLSIIVVLLVLFYGGIADGAEINVVFRGNVIDVPLGVSNSSLNEAEVYAVGLRSFLSSYGVLSIEKLIPNFELKDTLGVTRTGEIVRLTDYSRYFILGFLDDAHADAFLADAEKSQWISAAQKPQRVSLCVSSKAAEPSVVSESSYPNDPMWFLQWNLNGEWGIRLPEAWNLISGLSRGSVYIGVIDTGIPHVPFYTDHEDLVGRVDGDHYWDWSSCPGYDGDLGQLEHGLGVAGIIGASVNNGAAIAGIDPLCRIHAESDRVDFNGQCIDGVRYSAETARGIVNSTQIGVEILNMSLTIAFNDLFVGSALSDAYKMNILSVASAGNGNSPVPTAPSLFQGVVSVGATDENGVRVAPPNFDWGSNYGPCLDIMAPGGGHPDYQTLSYRDGTMSFNGTSGAAPHVTGVASLLLSINPNLYNDDLEGIMESSSTDRGDPGRDDYYGWGVLDAEQAVKRVLPPYSIEHRYASGNGGVHDLGTEAMEFCGVPGLALGVYPSTKIKVTRHVEFDKLYSRTPYVWGRGVPTTGYSAVSPNFGQGYTRVSNITPDGFDLETYTYHVYNVEGQDCGYTINGIEDIRSPSVLVVAPSCGDHYVTNAIVHILWTVDDEYLEGIRCSVALNMNGGEGIWTSLGSNLSVDDVGHGHYEYQVPSGQNVIYPNCIIRVIARDSNNHEGLGESCGFTIEYQTPPGGGGPKEPTPIEDSDRMSAVPEKSYLGAVYPNPFNPSTQISFGLAKPSEMRLRVYDASGRLVRLLEDGYRVAGHYTAIWDGLDNKGVLAPSGIYFCQLRITSFVETKKMVLLR